MQAAAKAEDALRALVDELDPRSPMAPTLALIGERLGHPVDQRKLLAFWEGRSPGSLVSDARYRWELTHARAPGASYDVPYEQWVPWREKDARVISREGPAFELRLTLPISIADGCELLALLSTREETRDVAAPMLEEAEAVFRKDLAGFVHAAHSWKDTFALYALTRRMRALDRMMPFAIAVAACYTPLAKQKGHVPGRRFPFHAQPLASATAMLASGLLALGSDTRLVAELASFLVEERSEAGWGDAGGPPDVLTTVLVAELLSRIDPSFDPTEASDFLVGQQRDDGTWRALGPEVPWLTDRVARLLRDAERPFASRFRFPHLPEMNRDSKTGLPYYAYFTDLVRLFAEIPGLASARVQVAFMDLAGFRAFNNAYGQDLGDAVLRAIADELGAIDDAVAIRDGGDEFLLIGSPTGRSLPSAIADFRERWPSVFVEHFGEGAPPVVARVLTGEVSGGGLRAARERLGREVGALKHRETELGRVGLADDLGALD